MGVTQTRLPSHTENATVAARNGLTEEEFAEAPELASYLGPTPLVKDCHLRVSRRSVYPTNHVESTMRKLSRVLITPVVAFVCLAGFFFLSRSTTAHNLLQVDVPTQGNLPEEPFFEGIASAPALSLLEGHPPQDAPSQSGAPSAGDIAGVPLAPIPPSSTPSDLHLPYEPFAATQMDEAPLPPSPPESAPEQPLGFAPNGNSFPHRSPVDEEAERVLHDMDAAIESSREVALHADSRFTILAPAAPGPDLFLSYYVPGDGAYPDRRASFTIYWTNEGDQTAQDVVITQTLPLSATYADHWSNSYLPDYNSGRPPLTLDGHVATWHLGDVEPGWYGWLAISAELDPALSIGAVLSGEATATVAAGETDTADNTALLSSVVLAPAPDITLDNRTNWNEVYEGAEITYQIYVHNSGVLPAENVRISDTLPLSLTHLSNWNSAYLPNYVSNPFTATVSGRSVVWDLGTLEPGWTAYLYIQASLVPELAAGATITNEVVASIAAGEVDTADNRMDRVNTILPPSADLYTSKWQSSGVFQPGQNVTYGLYWTNKGVLTATNVRLTDILPLSLTYIADWGSDYTPSYTSNITLATISGNTLMWELGDVAPGWSGNRYVEVQVDPALGPGSILSNQAEISQTTAESVTVDNVAHHQVMLGPDLWFSKWLDTGGISPGYDAGYWLYWENRGELVAANSRVTETLPAGMSFVSADSAYYCQSSGCTGWEPITPTVSGDTILWEVGDVEPGWYGWIYLTTHLDAATPLGTVVVNGAAIGHDGGSNRWPSADIERNVAELARPDMHVEKYLDYSSLYPGGEVTYRIWIANESVLTATNTRLTDTLPAGMTFVDEWNGPVAAAVDGNAIVWNLGDVPANSSRTIYVRVFLSTQKGTT